MSTLTGRTIANSYTELLKTASSGGITSALTVVEDGDATSSALQISSAGIASSGSLLVVGGTSLSTLEVSSSSNFTGISSFANIDINGGDIANSVVINKSPTITLGGDLSGSVTLTNLSSATLNATVVNNSVVLGTDTIGNYVATISGTANEISVSGSGSETAAVTLSLPSTLSFAGKTISDLGSVTTSDINGGTIDGTAIGSSSATTGRFTQINVVTQNPIRFEDTAGGEYVGIRAPGTVSSSYTLTLPTANGAAGFVMVTDGSGNLSWQNPYGGGATSTISAGDSSLAVVDAGSGTITGAIDGVNRIVVNSTGVSITGTLSVTGAISGTASSANTLSTSRNFSISGDITAPTISFNGSGNVALVSTLANGVVNNANIGTSAAIAYSKLATLATGQVLLGNAGIPTATTIGGDATVNATGSLTISNGAITNTKVSASAAIAFSKLGSLATGQVVAGNAGVATATTLSGDATISATGVLTIANDAITTSKILDGSVTYAKLDPAAISLICGFFGFRISGTHLVVDYGSGNWILSDYVDSVFASFSNLQINSSGHLIGTY